MKSTLNYHNKIKVHFLNCPLNGLNTALPWFVPICHVKCITFSLKRRLTTQHYSTNHTWKSWGKKLKPLCFVHVNMEACKHEHKTNSAANVSIEHNQSYMSLTYLCSMHERAQTAKSLRWWVNCNTLVSHCSTKFKWDNIGIRRCLTALRM